MGTLFQEILSDTQEIQSDMGNPSFTWNGAIYQCIPNAFEYKKDLEDGGFATDLMLELTVSRYNSLNQPVFSGDQIPKPQDKLTYQNNSFRIITVMDSPVINNAYGVTLKIVAVCSTRGI